jgi:hypothetical protein
MAIGCLIASAVSMAAGIALGQTLGGVSLGVGFILGAANGFVADRMLTVPLSYLLSSLGRLAFFSLAALAAGWAIGWRFVWLVILGLGLAQFVLVAVATRQVISR